MISGMIALIQRPGCVDEGAEGGSVRRSGPLSINMSVRRRRHGNGRVRNRIPRHGNCRR